MTTKLSWKFVTIAAVFPILLAGGLFLLSHLGTFDPDLGSGFHGEHDRPGGGAANAYSCPMHPEVIQAGPGSCPICEMELAPTKTDQSTANSTHDGR